MTNETTELATAAARQLYEARFAFERNSHRTADRHGVHMWGCYRQRDVAELLTVEALAAIESEARAAERDSIQRELDSGWDITEVLRRRKITARLVLVTGPDE